MASARDSKLYRLFQLVACVIGIGLILGGAAGNDKQLLGYGLVIFVHGLVATCMIWLDVVRSQKSSGSP